MTNYGRKQEHASIAEPDLPPRELENAASLNAWKPKLWAEEERVRRDVIVECGWGRLIFAHTFESNELLAEVVKAERENQRDIALYVGDPHVVISLAVYQRRGLVVDDVGFEAYLADMIDAVAGYLGAPPSPRTLTLARQRDERAPDRGLPPARTQ